MSVDLILEFLSTGMKIEEVAEDYRMSIEDARVTLLYAPRYWEYEKIFITSGT